MNLKRIRTITEQLRHERFRFRPSRRTQTPKANGGLRPLSIPNFSEKLVQEALRLLLEAYYEPRFLDSSHGFRSGRGCHTALAAVKRGFKGTVWFIEGDIRGCFDNIDQSVLMDILSKDITDGRLLNLIRKCLEAALLSYSDAQIIDVYQQRFNGVAQYYKYAVDRRCLCKLKYVMEVALTKTLANKFRTSVARIYRKIWGKTSGRWVHLQDPPSRSTDEKRNTVYLLGRSPAQSRQTGHRAD